MAAIDDDISRLAREHDRGVHPLWRRQLLVTAKGAPRAVLANIVTALREAPEWAEVLTYNEFSCRVEPQKQPPWKLPVGDEWRDVDDGLAAEWLQRQGIMVRSNVVHEGVDMVAREHAFHPVRDYLDGLRWDRKPRLETWAIDYLGALDDEYVRAVSARWLISAVARIYKPGCKADCCLILEGPQGTLKSTALKTLGDPWFTDEIAELGTKDAGQQLQGTWIIELAELNSLSRAEVNKAKAFLSRATERFRWSYGRRVVEYPRQCVFAGSVNRSEYLRDETGGRRFWPIACGAIDIERLAKTRDQLWAEAVMRYGRGDPWWLDTPSWAGSPRPSRTRATSMTPGRTTSRSTSRTMMWSQSARC